MENNYSVQGFFEGRRVREKKAVSSRSLERAFVGFKLDEIKIVATIRSEKDIENVINFLLESSPCFK